MSLLDLVLFCVCVAAAAHHVSSCKTASAFYPLQVFGDCLVAIVVMSVLIPIIALLTLWLPRWHAMAARARQHYDSTAEPLAGKLTSVWWQCMRWPCGWPTLPGAPLAARTALNVATLAKHASHDNFLAALISVGCRLLVAPLQKALLLISSGMTFARGWTQMTHNAARV